MPAERNIQGTLVVDEAQPERSTSRSASTPDLVRTAIDEAKTLVRLEVELAKRETRAEIKKAKAAGIAFGAAALLAILGLAMLLVSLVLATGAEWEVALGIGGAFLVIAGITAFAGSNALPKKPLDRTRHRVEGELQQMKERVA